MPAPPTIITMTTMTTPLLMRTTLQQSQPDNNHNNPNEIICSIHQEVINFAKAWQDGFNRLPAI